MDADDGRFVGGNLSAGKGEVMGSVGLDAVEVAVEISEVGGHFDGLFPLHQFFLTAAVLDDLRDGAGFECVLFLVITEVADAGHGAVFIHDFAEDGGSRESGHAGEVDAGFGVTGATEDAVLDGLKGKDVTGLDEGLWAGCVVGEKLDCLAAVGCGDAGGDVFGGINGDGEGGAVPFAVAAGHGGEIECFDPLGGDRCTDEPPTMGGHEGDHFGGDEGGGTDEVRFVFASRVVRDDDEFSRGDVGHDCLDGAEYQMFHAISCLPYANSDEMKVRAGGKKLRRSNKN